ncbi:MAG: serine/threonine-protein kinase [Verrucomicrobiota bacterium]
MSPVIESVKGTLDPKNKSMGLLEEGQIIRDTYEVERFLGEGAFAEVYRVKHRFLGRQAMKVFKRVGMNLDDINDVLGEAILLSRIGHPNIGRVFNADVFESKRGVCGFFTMENVSGGSLEKFWHSHGVHLVPIETTLDLMKQVCRGIAQAHRENPPIIHRDIKPQNILVGYEADGLRARASDFGLAKKVNPLTLLATAAGTLQFKPPEVFTPQKVDSCAGDVWAIGTTLYLLLTDKLPHPLPAGATWDATDLFEGSFPPPSEINPDANKALDHIVLKALDKRPEARYATAKELLDALEHWKPGTSESASGAKFLSSEASKTVLGSHSPVDERSAEALVERSFKARQAGRLAEAADLMEEAFNKSEKLRAKYAQQVKLWRCGISM